MPPKTNASISRRFIDQLQSHRSLGNHNNFMVNYNCYVIYSSATNDSVCRSTFTSPHLLLFLFWIDNFDRHNRQIYGRNSTFFCSLRLSVTKMISFVVWIRSNWIRQKVAFLGIVSQTNFHLIQLRVSHKCWQFTSIRLIRVKMIEFISSFGGQRRDAELYLINMSTASIYFLRFLEHQKWTTNRFSNRIENKFSR